MGLRQIIRVGHAGNRSPPRGNSRKRQGRPLSGEERLGCFRFRIWARYYGKKEPHNWQGVDLHIGAGEVRSLLGRKPGRRPVDQGQGGRSWGEGPRPQGSIKFRATDIAGCELQNSAYSASVRAEQPATFPESPPAAETWIARVQRIPGIPGKCAKTGRTC